MKAESSQVTALPSLRIDDSHYVLRLYVAGTTPRSSKAITSIHALCREYLRGRYDLRVIDIYQQPDDADLPHLLGVPTLVKSSPFPMRRIIGDLSDPQQILEKLRADPSVLHDRERSTHEPRS